MGSWTGTGLTGNGHHVLDAPVYPTDIAVTVTSLPPKVMIVGQDPTQVQHLKYAGTYGAGCFADDSWACDPPVIFAWETIHYMSQDFQIPDRWGAGLGTPSVWWGLKPGVTINMTVFW